ncbi:Na+/H+ antiporter NhaC family protein [Thalassotalea profundi]|uniref:Na+/H+ antiporter NhaC n=1 Tax=Thalassotalea profundi TaxID=2036687 RepID=A0ABQ3IVP0_9GAMM|nr:Na+/H+ antiporter NhaC family protein [Thalassotalea profundi]GHE95926.1 Na+/H+ antiporter NhaC [Thalassotalea profundi]
MDNVKKASFSQSLFSVGTLLVLVLYGLMLRPLLLEQSPFPLEIVFLLAAIIAIGQLFYLGFSWSSIQMAVTNKLSKAIPTILLLFAIGLLIGSWLISGTIPMLVYYALKIVSPEHIYIIAFLVPIFFSMCTGTSWGSIATIGLVIITVAQVINADLGIVTGAIVGGAYFGDKMSPLSDTTNIAAMASNVELYQHIKSMLFTTLPSAVLAALGFFALDYIYPAQMNSAVTHIESITLFQQTLSAISSLFNFHYLLMLPPIVILYGSITRKPPLPILILSSLIACFLALIFQSIQLDDVVQTLYKGFDIAMIGTGSEIATHIPEHIGVLFNRGGLYALNEPIIITILVFIYVGAIDCISAMSVLVNKLLSGIKRQFSLVAASLFSSAIVNAITSSQYANSFIVGEAFGKKYDQLNISRKVLSRSLEDTGTMIESLVPWSTTAVFIYASLGVAIQDYWHWQLLSLINIPIAFICAFFAIGFFKDEQTGESIYGQ